jgi:hypothetical protein
MAPSRGGAPGESVAARIRAGRCRRLQPGGRPPCAEGAKAGWPHHGGGFPRAHRARPSAEPHTSIRLLQVALTRREAAPAARGALRAPFKDVRIVLTTSTTSVVERGSADVSAGQTDAEPIRGTRGADNTCFRVPADALHLESGQGLQFRRTRLLSRRRCGGVAGSAVGRLVGSHPVDLRSPAIRCRD